jgi:enoyl-[acyl-carrier protein] reductase I
MLEINLEGRKGLVFGVANQRSIAWAIADICHQAGAQLAFSYQGEKLKSALEKLTAPMNDPRLLQCDVTSDDELDAVFETIEQDFGKLDFIVHSVAFAPRDTFEKPFYETSRDAWHMALDISAYSLVAMAQRAQPLMKEGGSIIALSYLAAERVIPHYNLMGVAKAALEASVRFLAYDLGKQGVRVNAISAGALRTLAARGIAGFGSMYSKAGDLSMLERNITQQEVAGMALTLIADQLGSGVTGETIYVDAGYHAMGMFLQDLEAGKDS